MAIPDFVQQSQQSMQSGLQLGSALRNAQAMEEQRVFNQQMQPLQLQQAQQTVDQTQQNIEQQSQLRPLQVQQQQLQNQAMEQENLQKGLAQDAILLSSLSEEDGKKIIPQLINKYEGNESIVAGFNKLYKSTGNQYISNNLQAVAAFTDKPIGGKKRTLSEPEKNLETLTDLQNKVDKATASGDADLLAGATKQLENFQKLTNKFGATAQEKQDIKTSGVTTKSNIERRQGYIDAGVDAADSYGNLKRSMELLNTVGTGGYDQAALKAKQLFGIESADEAELSANMGKSVMAQLKPLFGSAFTEGEGNRLVAIEAGFGKSTEGNKRLIKETMKITERAMRRGLAAAKDQGDQFVIDEMELMIASFKDKKETVEEPVQQQAFANAPAVGAVQGGYTYNGGDPALQASWTKI